MKTLVLGLGNPILSDDGVGIHVVRAAAARYEQDDGDEVVFEEASAGGLRLLEVIAGYDRLVLVDAIQTRGGIPGTRRRLSIADVQSSMHAGSTHDLSFSGALAFGRKLGMKLPPDAEILIFAIEAEDVLTFGEALTPSVAAALPRAVDELLADLKRMLPGRGNR